MCQGMCSAQAGAILTDAHMPLELVNTPIRISSNGNGISFKILIIGYRINLNLAGANEQVWELCRPHQ